MSGITLDRDYVKLASLLKRECERRSIPFETKELNPQGHGDLIFMDREHQLWSWEIKGQAEACGNLNHLEAQLQSQAAECDRLGLMIYGPPIEPAEDGNCWAYAVEAPFQTWERGLDSGGTRKYTRRYYRQSYLGYRTKLARFYSDFGIIVTEVPSLEALATEIIAQYQIANTLGEGKTFTRYIPEKVRVSEANPEKARFMRQVMGLEAGIGEEIAEAIAEWLGKWRPLAGHPALTLRSLIDMLEMEEDLSAHPLAAQPLRNGSRTVGPAAVARLRTALGI